MSKKWITILVIAVVAGMLLPTVAFAACRVEVADTVSLNGGAAGDPIPLPGGTAVTSVAPNGTSPLNLNAEGVSERVADLLISDTGVAPFCFTAGQNLVITYNAVITSPASLTVPGNIDVYDSLGTSGLTISGATLTPGFAANLPQTVVTITVSQAGTAGDLRNTANGAAIRVKNIRVNAETLGSSVTNITATFSGPGYVATPLVVGTKVPTVGSSFAPLTGNIAAVGAFGAANTLAITNNQSQSNNSGLNTPSGFQFTEGFGDAFRQPGGACTGTTSAPPTGCVSRVANDIATTGTSLVISVSNIPSGVTLTFPSTITTSASQTANGVIFTAVSTTLTNAGAGGTFTVVYTTSRNNPGAISTVTIETADNPDPGTVISSGAGTTLATTNPNCKLNNGGTAGATVTDLNTGSRCDPNPKIGVKVGASSGFGTMKLTVLFGPGAADQGEIAQVPGDDLSSVAIPRYVGRKIFDAVNFVEIVATKTTLLYPFASTFGGFNTGISVANTCGDTIVFGTNACNQTGGITFYFFPTGGTAFSLNTDVTNGGKATPGCRGLNANGQLAPGGVFACGLTNLLAAAGAPAAFDGYVIAVTSFNKAHGFSVQFSTAGPYAANNALVLGGATRGSAAEGLLE